MSSECTSSSSNGSTNLPREAVNINSSPLTGKSLEDSSKEDLIKQIKKQRILLQKIKSKCDELSQTNSTLEVELREARQNNNDMELEIYVKKNAALQDECQLNLRKYKEAVEQIECMKSKEVSLTSAMQCLQSEIAELTAENKDLKSVERDKQDLTTEQTEFKQQFELMKNEIDKLHEELSVISSDKQRLEQESEKNQSVIEQLQTEKQLSDKILLETKNNLALLNDENSSLRLEWGKAASDVQELQQQIDIRSQTETDELNELRIFKEELLNKLEVAMKDGENLRNVIEESRRLQEENDEKLESRTDELANSRIKLEEARSDVDNLQKQITLLQAELQNTKLEYDRLLSEEKAARVLINEELEETTRETAALRAALAESELRQVESEGNNDESNADNLTGVLLQLEETRSELDSLQNQNQLLQAELENALVERDRLLFEENREEQSDRTALEEEVANLQSEVEELRGQLEGAEFESEELKAKLEEAETVEAQGNAALQEELRVLREQVASLKCEDGQNLKVFKDQIEVLKEREKKIEEIVDDLCNSNGEVNLCQDVFVKLNGVKNRVCDMEAEIDKLNFQLQDKKVEILELQDKYAEMDKINEELAQVKLQVQRQVEENEELKSNKELVVGEFEKLKQMDLKHEEQLFAYENEINVFQNSNRQLREELDSCQLKLRELEEEKAQLVEEHKACSLQIENAASHKDSCDKLQEEIKSENLSLTDRLNVLQHELNDLKSEKTNWLTEKNLLHAETEELRKHEQEFIERKANESEYNQCIVKMEAELAQAVNEKTELEAKVVELSEEIRKLESERPTAEAHKCLTQSLTNCEESLRLSRVQLEEAEKEMTDISSEREKLLLELASIRSQFINLKADDEHNQAQLQAMTAEKKELETVRTELLAKIAVLQFEKEQLQSKVDDSIREVKQMQDKNRQTESQLEKEKECHRITVGQLEHLQQQANRHNLMNLELADYERLLGDLNQQVKKFQEEKEELNQEVKQREELANSLKTQLERIEKQQQQTEERSTKIKVLLIKTKKELAEVKKRESEKSSEESRLHTEIELARQKAEDFQVEIANVTSANQKLQDIITTTKDSHSRIVRSLEARIASLQSDLAIMQQEYSTCQADFENYKTRVHSVLKQQKSKPVTSTDELADTCARECLEKSVEQFKIKLQEVNDQLTVLKAENEAIQEENDRLVQKSSKLSEILSKQEDDWKERFESLTSDENKRQEEHLEMMQQLQRQNEIVVSTYKEQLQSVREEHERTVRDLRLQLNAAETELWKCQRDIKPVLPKDEVDLFDVSNTERQEGEGSENTELASGTPVQYQPDLLVSSDNPLELLLNPQKKSSTVSISDSQLELETLEQQVATSMKKMEHLTELLNESEASNMRLTEQTRILKEEIRRLERNQERKEHTANMEYLKNVIVKFLTLASGDERERLVPVLTMMLQLSPEERSQLSSIASTGHSQNAGEGDSQVTWGSYLPRWSGLV